MRDFVANSQGDVGRGKLRYFESASETRICRTDPHQIIRNTCANGLREQLDVFGDTRIRSGHSLYSKNGLYENTGNGRGIFAHTNGQLSEIEDAATKIGDGGTFDCQYELCTGAFSETRCGGDVHGESGFRPKYM